MRPEEYQRAVRIREEKESAMQRPRPDGVDRYDFMKAAALVPVAAIEFLAFASVTIQRPFYILMGPDSYTFDMLHRVSRDLDEYIAVERAKQE